MSAPLEDELLAFLFWLYDSAGYESEHRALIASYLHETSPIKDWSL